MHALKAWCTKCARLVSETVERTMFVLRPSDCQVRQVYNVFKLWGSSKFHRNAAVSLQGRAAGRISHLRHLPASQPRW